VVPHHKFPKEDLVQKFYHGLTMASRTIIDASAGGSIIELTPTEAFTLFKKVTDNDTWASSGRLLPVPCTGNVKGVLQVEKEDLLESKIDSLRRRLEKMEIEKKKAQDLKAAEARSTCEECREYGHVQKDYRKPRCSIKSRREICRTSAMGRFNASLSEQDVKMFKQCSVVIENGLEKQGDLGCSMILCSVGHSSLRKHYGILEQV
jgi:hypothetical protein